MSTQYQTFLYLFIFRSIPSPCFHYSLFESEALRFQIASAFYSNGKNNDYQVKILYSRWLLQCLPPVSLTSPTITIRRVHVIHSQKPYEIAVMGPPNSQIDFTKVSPGPEMAVIRDNTTSKINSTYLYIDPKDPSIVYLSVNASHGYTSYNLTDIPSNLIFTHMEQGGDLSYPECNPMRVDGTKAVVGNDPADSIENWSTPWLEQNGTLQIDALSKKEGIASLKVSGKTDSWSNLGVRYDSPGAWNLAGYSSIGVWVRCNESALFSITLVDSYGGSRTFWAIEAGDGSATTGWKRFVVNLTDYTSQTPGFSINSVDHIDLFVYSTVGKNLSFWIDDLTVDTSVALEKFVYKDRVPVDETVVAYFYTRIEDK